MTRVAWQSGTWFTVVPRICRTPSSSRSLRAGKPCLDHRACPYAFASPGRCYYGAYMQTLTLKVARIGNSRGVRLPAGSLRRYRIGETVLMEERSDGILLRPTGAAVQKLSWEDTAREMAASPEDWSDWDATRSDGLDQLPWEGGRKSSAAESPGRSRATQRPRPRR